MSWHDGDRVREGQCGECGLVTTCSLVGGAWQPAVMVCAGCLEKALRAVKAVRDGR
jgi:hypothetical protein